MLNVKTLTDTMSRMELPQLQQYAALHKNDPYIVTLALSIANQKKQMKAGQAGQAGGEQQDGEGSHPGGHPAKFMQADVQPRGTCGDRRCAESPAELERCLGRLGTLYQNEQQSQCRDLNLPVAERGKCKNSRRTRQ